MKNAPAISRRAVLGALASVVCRPTRLVGQNAAAVQMIPVDGEGARYWSRWRGPSGQGLVTGSYPDTWSDTQNVVWKTPVPGRGNSSPIVWRDRVFLSTALDNGRRLSVLAFRRADGVKLWETFAPD